MKAVSVEWGALDVTFEVILKHKETAGKEIVDLIPAIDWITANYFWEYISGRGFNSLSFLKCKKMLGLKSECKQPFTFRY